jgi:hypothetical protein
MTMLTAQSPEYYGVTRVVGPDGGPVAVAHAAFKSSILFTRPNNATAYTAGDVIGRADTVTPANAGDAIIRLAGVGPVGGALSLETVELHFDTNAIPAGMTTFRLHLYGLPPAPMLDNAVYNLSSAEIARYLGFITLNAPVDLGDTIYSITTDIRRHINLVPYSGSLYAELETVGAFTPAALTPVTLKVSSRQLSPATQLVEDLPIAGSFPALPTLNLKFSENRNLIDDVTGRQLITFTRASSATFIDSAGRLQTAAVDVPRFDHNPTTGESLGLLVEDQRTNSLLRSEEFDNAAWPRSGTTLPTITADAAVAPNGATTADLWTRAITGSNFISQAIAKAASAIQYTFSVFVKQSVGNFCALRCQGTFPNKVDVVFNLSSGTISTAATVAGGTFTGPSASITPYPNGWYRLTVTATSDTATGYQCFASFSSNGVLIDGIDSVSNSAGLLWGAQLEAGAFATSYIPTTAAAVTCSADVASITGANFSSWYRQDEGTVFARYSFPQSPTAGGGRVFQFTNAAATNLIWLRAQGGVNRIYDVTDASVSQASFNQGAYAAGIEYRAALAAKANDFGFAENGGASQSDSSGTMPSVDRAGIGMEPIGNGSQGNVHIRRLTYWPQRLSNSTLQTITQ